MSYDVNISGLKGSADYNGPALGAFILQLDFNSTIASAQSVAFGNKLNLTGSDLQYSDLSTAGQVYLSETSFDSVAALEAAQGKNFTLATVTFAGLQPGTTAMSFDLAQTSLSDENGNTLDLISTNGSTLTVTAIPEPASTACIFGVLAVGLGVVRRRFFQNRNTKA
jgi:hypothetical protein